MKPSWEDAPEWAKYLAMDGQGGWYWFEKKPKPNIFFSQWIPKDLTRCEKAYVDDQEYWNDSLEKRPTQDDFY
jgi:hypothetical protein